MQLDINRIIPNFFMYAIPSIFAMIISGIFVIIDGIFVGNSTGDAGLAAINIAFPLYSCFTATGIGIGAGGAVLMSMSLGANDTEEAERILGRTLAMICLTGATLTVLGLIFFVPLLKIFGASGQIFEYAYDYSLTAIIGGIFVCLASGLPPLIRNDGNPRKCMYITIIGLLTNIVLDWFFIMFLGWGLFGAAFATILGQLLTAVIGISHFLLNKSRVKFKKINFRIDTMRAKKILLIGTSPFGTGIATGLMTMMFNWRSLSLGGDLGVAAFCTISYAIAPMRLLLEGIGEGLQPLTSFYHGAGLEESEKRTLRVAYLFAFIMALLGATALFLLSDKIPYVFGASSELAHIISKGVKLISFCFLFMSISKVSASYFYAVGKPGHAAILIYGDTFIMMPLGLVLLPLAFEIEGVWLAYANTYVILGILAAVLMRKLFVKRHNAVIKEWKNNQNQV